MNLVLATLLGCQSETEFRDYFEPLLPLSPESLIKVCEPPIDDALVLDTFVSPPIINPTVENMLLDAYDRWVSEVEAQLPTGFTYEDLVNGDVSFHMSASSFNDGSSERSLFFNTGDKIQNPGDTETEFGCTVGIESSDQVTVSHYLETSEYISDGTSSAILPISRLDVSTLEIYGSPINAFLDRMQLEPCLDDKETPEILDCPLPADEIFVCNSLPEFDCSLSLTNLVPVTDINTHSGNIVNTVENLATDPNEYFNDSLVGNYFYNANEEK